MKIDIKDCKNTTAMRDKIRKNMTALLIEFLKEKFEDEPEDVVQVGTNEIAVCVAIAEDADGFPHDVCVVVKPEEVDDLEAHRIAREVKEKIEANLKYPGTIKITVVRETRAIEEAK